MSEIVKHFSTLNNNGEKVTYRIGANASDVDYIDGNSIISVQEKLDNLKEIPEGIENRVTSAEEDIQTINDNLEVVSADVNTLKQSIPNNLSSRLSSIESTLGSEEVGLIKKVEDINEKVNNVAAAVGGVSGLLVLPSSEEAVDGYIKYMDWSEIGLIFWKKEDGGEE